MEQIDVIHVYLGKYRMNYDAGTRAHEQAFAFVCFLLSVCVLGGGGLISSQVLHRVENAIEADSFHPC